MQVIAFQVTDDVDFGGEVEVESLVAAAVVAAAVEVGVEVDVLVEVVVDVVALVTVFQVRV